jgi:replication factor A1
VLWHRIIIVLDLDVISPALPDRLGAAVNIETAAQQAAQAPQVQQPPAQQPQSFGQQSSTAPPQQQQQQQPNSFNSSYNRPVSKSPISDKNVRAIEALNPYCSPWTIKCIVDSKGDMKTWNNARGSGNLFSVTLKDKTGLIRATAFKEDANRLFAELQVGQAYLITRGQIKPANKQYCDFHEYEITFGRDTQVCPVDSGADLKIEYNLVKLSELEEKQPNDLVDICGIASDIGMVTDVVARKDSRTLKKRNITIVDDSNTSVELTLWGKTAEEFEPEAPGQAKHVVVIRKAKVSDWNGAIEVLCSACPIRSVLTVSVVRAIPRTLVELLWRLLNSEERRPPRGPPIPQLVGHNWLHPEPEEPQLW